MVGFGVKALVVRRRICTLAKLNHSLYMAIFVKHPAGIDTLANWQ